MKSIKNEVSIDLWCSYYLFFYHSYKSNGKAGGHHYCKGNEGHFYAFIRAADLQSRGLSCYDKSFCLQNDKVLLSWNAESVRKLYILCILSDRKRSVLEKDGTNFFDLIQPSISKMFFIK